MMQSVKFWKPNKKFIWIALIHWILTFFTDHIIFEYVMWDFSDVTQTVKTAMTYGAKAVFLLILIGIYQGLYFFFAKADKRLVKYTLIYFCINMILLFLVWPGIWRMDEFGILNSAVKLLPVFWQNYLTSLFYVFSLMLVPVPSGVIIVQCALISLMAGYIIRFFVNCFGKSGLFAFLPFLLFPVLDSNLYPMRMSLYGVLELFLLVLLFEKKINSGKIIEQRDGSDERESGKRANGKWSITGSWIFICILGAVVTVWRTEAIYYFLLFPLLLVILFIKNMDRKALVRIICTYLVCSLCLFVPQTVGDKMTSGNQYDLTSVVLPLIPLVEKAYGREECREQLNAIDQVIDVEMAVEGAKENKSGISLFWSRPDFQREYTDEQYKAFKNAYYGLIMKFPAVFLAERWDCFVHSVDLLQNTTEIFTVEGVANYDAFREYPGTAPVDESMRNAVIRLLEWRSTEDYETKKTGYSVIYGNIVPICILLSAWAVCLVRRKWHEFFLLSLPLVKAPLIFLTAPSRLFMYYYSLYLTGYFALLYLFLTIWKKLEGPVKKTIAYGKRNGIKAAFHAAMERVDKGHQDEMSRLASDYKGCREWSISMEREKMEDEMKAQRTRRFPYEPLISIVVPAYEPRKAFMKELITSVIEQTYTNWELIIADAGKTAGIREVLAEFSGDVTDAVKYKKLEENKGISENTNAAVEEAKGDYIALLDHDDLLTEDALYSMVERINRCDDRERILAVYSDEDKCDGNGENFYEPHFKPDFNLDLLLSNNYICHFLMVEAGAMKELKLRREFDGAQDYDLVLRLSARADSTKEKILHVQKVLYHWRCHEGSTAVNTESKRYAYDAGRKALEAYYKEKGIEGVRVEDSSHLGFYRTLYSPDIFAARKDVAAVCGRVIEKGLVTGGPELESCLLFKGLKKNSSGYMHRADTRLDVDAADERALKLRPGLGCTLEEALKKGMKLVYDPEFIKIL